jgi:uncharacterized membrane protein (DUF485 family)
LKHGLFRYQNALLVAGVLLLILGLRIFIGIRFVAEIPQIDDEPTLLWLQQWGQGVHDWGFLWHRHNGHPMVLYYLANLGQYLLNGYWDGRLDFLVYAFIHTAYAAVVMLTFWNVLTPRDRGWLLPFIFALFAIPFAGYRIAWGLLWPDTAMMLFSLWALYLAAYHGQRWSAVVFISLLAALASVNTAAGCLGGLTVAALTLFRAALAWRLTRQDAVVSLICLAIFLVQYLAFPASTSFKPGFLEAINAFVKALAWPVDFVAGIGVITLAVLAGLVTAQIFLPSFRRPNVAFLTGAGGLIFLVAVAVGACRGDNNNMGIPSGRYTDIFIMVPLLCATALCLLYRGCTGHGRTGWGIFAGAWLCLQVLGFSIHIFYRVIPFMARENGEWDQAYDQVLFRDLVRGTADISAAQRRKNDPTLGLTDLLQQVVRGQQPMPAMTIPMIAGFPLGPGSQGNYVVNGYYPSYQPRPAQLYWGSFDASHPLATNTWFRSSPFKPQTDYLTVDVLVDKKARLTNYRLKGLRLALVDETTGQRKELLPLLADSFPFLFRDWELVCVRVIPGDEYRLESSAAAAGPVQWIAFSEPLESGHLTPLIIGVSQSGKLLCLCGAGLLTLVLGLNWLNNSAPDQTAEEAAGGRETESASEKLQEPA